jgi:16S rRNA (cytosine1402-N4)-methyltransferase
VLDCTLGGGGHTGALLNRGTSVVAIDRDPDAVAHASALLAQPIADGKLEVFQGNFSQIHGIPELAGRTFDGILIDMGVSSFQLDVEERGFTFRPGAPLDMRMGPDAIGDAASVLNETDETELAEIFRTFADEPRGRRLAAEVVRRRARSPFQSSDDLVNAIRAVLGPRSGPSDFARIFQGVRIAVNQESSALAEALPRLRELLKPSGVMVVISYHSGEDRMVKNAFREWSRGCVCPPRQPFCTCGLKPSGTLVTRKAIMASDSEIQSNPRARSARLRAWQKNA